MFKQTLLIDFDETISSSRGFTDPPNAQAVTAINALKEKFKIIIFSCRANKNILPAENEAMMIEYLNRYNIHYDEIAKRKPVFFAIIDDKSYNPALTDWTEITRMLLESAN